MPITSDTPITTTTETFTFDTWWMVGLAVRSDEPNIATVAVAKFRLSRIDEYGVVWFYKDLNGNFADRELRIPDLFSLAASDAAVGQTINDVIAKVGEIAVSQGIIA